MTQQNRRDFLKTSTAAASTAWFVGNSTQSFAGEKSSLEKINFACIGVGGKGSSDTDSAGRAGEIVALCDIDEGRLKGKGNKYRKAEKFTDYREMLEKLGDKIDAVTVSTPDHSHAPASIMAMKAGKHCFTQKPLTWSIGEARAMRELAEEKKLATQMGNQGTSNEKLRESVDIINAGVLGNITEVHVWTNRPIWPQGAGRPKGSPTPPGVHWDQFIGPAPYREYSSAYHPFKWRGWLDFGTGALGDMACHTMNMPVMALDLFDATSVEAESSGVVENETYPKWSQITYNFAANAKRGPIKMMWYDGGKTPPARLLHGEAKMVSSGALVIGDKGTLYSTGDYGQSYVMLPKANFPNFEPPKDGLPKSIGHFEEFARAIKGGEPAMSNFSYAGRLTETVLLGNLAVRLGKKVDWDSKKMEVRNAVEEAKPLIHRDYREGYSI